MNRAAHEKVAPHPPDSDRILFLDGWRCVAIVAVICYHYFVRWTPPSNPINLYPYAGSFAGVQPFRFGFYGVELFFVVSGFVITLTLTRCSTAWEFAVRRFARLFPAMVVCSVVTFLGLKLIPGAEFSRSWWAFLPSWTFVDPTLYRKLLHSPGLDWMDGAYWSLFAEVRFYVLAACVYFLARRRFPLLFLLLSGAALIADHLATITHPTRLLSGVQLLLVSEYLPWFLIGVGAFYRFRRVEARWSLAMIVVGISSLIVSAVEHRDPKLLSMAIVIPGVFLASLHLTWLQRCLATKWMTLVGACSYGLYLLHQFLGVKLIAWLGQNLPPAGWSSAIWAVFVALLLVGLSRVLFVHYEMPANRAITRLVGRPRAQLTTALNRGAAT